jgi:hypothetical protein
MCHPNETLPRQSIALQLARFIIDQANENFTFLFTDLFEIRLFFFICEIMKTPRA